MSLSLLYEFLTPEAQLHGFNGGFNNSLPLPKSRRHQVEDLSFGFVLPAPEDEQPPAETAPEKPQPPEAPPRSNPNTSAKRRRITADGSRESAHPPTKNPSQTTRKTGLANLTTSPRSTRTAARSHDDVSSAALPPTTATAAQHDVYDIPDHTSEEGVSRTGTGAHSVKRTSALRRSALSRAGGGGGGDPDNEAGEDDVESLPSPTPARALAPGHARSLLRSSSRQRGSGSSSGGGAGKLPSQPSTEEVIGESPADAPGSGQRRVEVRSSDAAEASSAILQRAVRMRGSLEEEDEVTVEQTSSPLARKSRARRREGEQIFRGQRAGGRGGRGGGAGAAAAARKSVRMPSAADDVDELSPANMKQTTKAPTRNAHNEVDELSPAAARLGTEKKFRVSLEDDLDELSPENRRRTTRLSTGNVAGEVDELLPEKTGETTQGSSSQRIEKSRKGKRASPKPTEKPKKARPTKRPETAKETSHAAAPEEAQEINDQEAAQTLTKKRRRRSAPLEPPEPDARSPQDEPVCKKRRRKPHESPAVQRQPKTRKDPGKQKAKPPRVVKPRKSNEQQAVDELEGDATLGTVPVTVQRFTKRVRYDACDEEPGADILASDIPFANRAGVNPVDVLSQMCEVLIENFLSNLEERAREAGDGSSKREFQTMMRALEAFREELRTRLLEQVSLNTFLLASPTFTQRFSLYIARQFANLGNFR